jgi:two-component system OmpR family response regulator
VAAMMRRPRHEITGPKPALAGWAAAPAAAAHSDSAAVLQHNGLELNHRTRTVEVGGEPLTLTRSEFDLLHVLLKGGGAVCTRADLVRAVRGDFYDEDTYISEADERAVEVHIGNLRRKLKEDPVAPRWLQTVRGVGYRLAPSRQDAAQG